MIRDFSSKPSRHESRPNSDSSSQFNNAPDAFPLKIPPPQSELDQDDYPDAQFWTLTEWQNYVNRETDRGNPPTKLGFLCDEEGIAASKERIKKMTDTAKKIWGELHHHRYDPKTWRCVNLSANQYYTNHMRIAFPEFQLCADDWKVQMFATIRFPDWSNGLRSTGRLTRSLKCFLKFFVSLIFTLGS
jgi:hypothetical protein